MSDVKRYRLNDYQAEWGDVYELEEDAKGPIVLYSMLKEYADHCADTDVGKMARELIQLRARVLVLTAALQEIRQVTDEDATLAIARRPFVLPAPPENGVGAI